jgi:hypothetical protein
VRDVSALLADEVLEKVGHTRWVFVIPKMLRPYFLHHRELLGKLARSAWETVLELMCAAAGDAGMRPGMVAVVQTAGDLGMGATFTIALLCSIVLAPIQRSGSEPGLVIWVCLASSISLFSSGLGSG